jgi:C-terminal processing protease CtpA/Prc
MKNTILLLCAILFVSTSCTEEANKIDNLKTFAQAYGYVKYFHPSDEASSIDWNRFAVYGAEEVQKCESREALITTLNKIFSPIATGIVFSAASIEYDFTNITPDTSRNYELAYWQHKGVTVGMNNQNSPYTSARVNRYLEIDEGSGFGNLRTAIDATQYAGKRFKYTGQARLGPGSEGTGHLWARVDNSDNTMGFFNNMNAYPISSTEWTTYEVIGNIDKKASDLVIGGYLYGKGTFYLDDMHLYYDDDSQPVEKSQWIEIPLKNSNFEASTIGVPDDQSDWKGQSKGYTYTLIKEDVAEGSSSVMIKYEGIIKKVLGESIFDKHPAFGELIERSIGAGIYCQIPLALYTTEENTFPKTEGLEELKANMKKTKLNPENLALRLGNVINAYNVFQHFYPYTKEVGVDLEKELEKALNRSYQDQTGIDHRITLEKFIAPLKDGHAWVSGGALPEFVPPIRWDWIEDKLVITNVLEEDLDVKIGDIVTKVNGQSAKAYFAEIYSRVSAGTKGWLNTQARVISLHGKEDGELILEIDRKEVILKHDRSFVYGLNSQREANQKKYAQLSDDLYYLNIGLIEMDTINALLPQLEEAKGIICDLRGYPNSNHDFISYLLSENDTSDAWMKIPHIIYPDQENIVKYAETGWEMEAKKPYLGDKNIVFIIDGTAISYAESYLGLIKGYKLATLVGQPTAGANGNINPFGLAANYTINWTGMKVLKQDGSQHHAVGVLPDVYVSRTIAGIESGKDEFLEKAIEVILE